MTDHINSNSTKAYIMSLQKEFGTKVDGIVGPKTLEAATEYYKRPVISHGGKLVPVSFDGIINHNFSLHELPDLTRNWTYRKGNIDNIVVHWSGLNANNAYQQFYAPKYKHLASNFLIGLNPVSKQYEVLQVLDTCQAAKHGGKINKQSISIDICQSPSVKLFETTNKFYRNAQIVKNRSNRGDEYIVDIDDQLCEYAKNFLKALRFTLDLNEKPVCKDENVYDLEAAKKYSIIGQHNVSLQSDDVAAWADKLYYDL